MRLAVADKVSEKAAISEMGTKKSRSPGLDSILASNRRAAARKLGQPTDSPADYLSMVRESNDTWLAAVVEGAENELASQSCVRRRRDVWKVLKVRPAGNLVWGEDDARVALGGDIRDVWRRQMWVEGDPAFQQRVNQARANARGAGRDEGAAEEALRTYRDQYRQADAAAREALWTATEQIEARWLLAETAALAAHARRPEIQQNPVLIVRTMILLTRRQRALTDPAEREKWLREHVRKQGAKGGPAKQGHRKPHRELIARIYEKFPGLLFSQLLDFLEGKLLAVRSATSERHEEISFQDFVSARPPLPISAPDWECESPFAVNRGSGVVEYYDTDRDKTVMVRFHALEQAVSELRKSLGLPSLGKGRPRTPTEPKRNI